MTHILIIGNATWLNRGCEAIELSTREILSETISDVTYSVVPFTVGDPREAVEGDGSVRRIKPPDFTVSRFSRQWVQWQVARRLDTAKEYRALVGCYDATFDAVGPVDAVLSVGGDNYSADYGRPSRFWALNEAGRRRGIPVFLWGASVGPFPEGNDTGVARDSLRQTAQIFVRESDSLDYLQSIGVVDNVALVADPAFTLSPKDCAELDILGEKGECVGVNLSPLYGRYTSMDERAWHAAAARTVSAIADATGRAVALVPHVMLPGQDDDVFLQRIADAVAPGVDMRLLPGTLGAREIKACIAQCGAFVGARTHATIAAFSSHVPTVTLAYSRKAYGINREIFGDTRWVVDAADYAPERVAELTARVLSDSEAADAVAEGASRLAERARSAGRMLARHLSGPGGSRL